MRTAFLSVLGCQLIFVCGACAQEKASEPVRIFEDFSLGFNGWEASSENFAVVNATEDDGKANRALRVRLGRKRITLRKKADFGRRIVELRVSFKARPLPDFDPFMVRDQVQIRFEQVDKDILFRNYFTIRNPAAPQSDPKEWTECLWGEEFGFTPRDLLEGVLVIEFEPGAGEFLLDDLEIMAKPKQR